jgi:asparagine synthase (glutamine-hydrolysing)
MCGIVGEIKHDIFSNDVSAISSILNIEQANCRQLRRGPDSFGIYQLDNLILGHRRLKIFDLTDKAAQPFIDPELGLAIIFNGAIYNFPKLKQELITRGYHFISNSDTEVILKAYHAWGTACVSRFEGMFAFALWERETKKLILARDRLGIKPLYYATTPYAFRFASTLPGLLAFADADTNIDAQAIHFYLTFHAVPEPLTIFKSIRKVAPGSIMTVFPDGKIQQEQYWQLRINEAQVDHNKTEEVWLTLLDKALTNAVEKQLAADVPVGILLSGGLDSSVLVALASRITKQKLQTFSIGFESVRNETGDEFYYSDIIAKRFSTEHHKFFISNNQLIDSLGDCVKQMSEPMPSHDNIGFYLLSKQVAQHVKVVLSGQGADELFAGYHWLQKLASFPQKDAVDKGAVDIYRRYIFDMNYQEYCNTVTRDWRTDDLAAEFVANAFHANSSKYLVNNTMQIDATFALANGPLGRMDNMTMAASLEARVPFLDEEVVALTSGMPLDLKLANGGKDILKRLGRKLLPREIIDRPKGYFPVPALKYLQVSMKKLIQEVLTSRRAIERGIFNSKAIQMLLSAPQDNLTPFGASKLWQIALLEYWLQQQGV